MTLHLSVPMTCGLALFVLFLFSFNAELGGYLPQTNCFHLSTKLAATHMSVLCFGEIEWIEH